MSQSFHSDETPILSTVQSGSSTLARQSRIGLFKYHWRLGVVLLIYTVIAFAHSQVGPLTIGNDEWAHFLYVRFISEQKHLPTTPDERDEAGYKSDAPPLYHLFVSGTTFWVEPTRLLRPLDSPRRFLADNIIISHALVHTAVEQFPYRGEVLLWHLGRGISILFGAVLIVLTYTTSLLIAPNRQSLALQAAAVVAFIPAVIFHSSVLSYESLSAAMSALFLLVALRILKQPNRWVWWLILGGVGGLSITTKYSAVLLPLEIVFIVWLAFNRQREQIENHAVRWISSFKHRLTPIIVAGLAMTLAIGWWFGFIIWHFNTINTQGPIIGVLQPILVGDASDTTSLEVASFLFDEENVEVHTRPPLPRNYGQLLLSFIVSFWSAPISEQFPPWVSPWLPLLFTFIGMLGLVNLWKMWRQFDRWMRQVLLLLVFHTLLILPLLVIRIAFSFDPREAAQGRHILMPAASAIAVMLVWGWEQWSPKLGWIVIGGLILWSVLVQVVWAAISYPPPISVWPKQAVNHNLEAVRPQNITVAQTIRLNSATWQVNADNLQVTLWWESLGTLKEDYLVELTLLDNTHRVASVSLAHPVQGRYPTRAWEPGDIIQDIHRLPVAQPLTENYQLQLRLLTRTGQPLPEQAPIILGQVSLTATGNNIESCFVWPKPNNLFDEVHFRPRSTFMVVAQGTPVLKSQDATGPSETIWPIYSADNFHIFLVGYNWPDSAKLFIDGSACAQLSFDIPSRNFDIPHIATPLEANFNNEIRLLGYELPTRYIQAGERLPLTLYWQALDYMGEDYLLFANPLDAKQQRWGGYDRRPRDSYSTLRWTPGEVITDPFGVPIDDDTPPGIYTLDFGFYRNTDNGAESLPLVVDDQYLEQKSVRIGPIKVSGPPPDVITANPDPQFALNQTFGNQITLLGYDLTDEVGQPFNSAKLKPQNLVLGDIEGLKLTLYWKAETTPSADYTTFVHLRDTTNKNVAQKDGPPANGRYPTSLWSQGEVIVDEILLPLTDLPSGRYIPVIGLYNFETGNRLLTSDDAASETSLEPVEIP